MVNPDDRTLVIAVLGLGEAGSVIARDLVAAGARVRGYDPAVAAGPGLTDTGSEAAQTEPLPRQAGGQRTPPEGVSVRAEPPRAW